VLKKKKNLIFREGGDTKGPGVKAGASVKIMSMSQWKGPGDGGLVKQVKLVGKQDL